MQFLAKRLLTTIFSIGIFVLFASSTASRPADLASPSRTNQVVPAPAKTVAAGQGHARNSDSGTTTNHGLTTVTD